MGRGYFLSGFFTTARFPVDCFRWNISNSRRPMSLNPNFPRHTFELYCTSFHEKLPM